jgi:hypothetical protein
VASTCSSTWSPTWACRPARPAWTSAREGYYCIELARRFGFSVHGIEPVRRHLDNAARALGALAAAEPEIAARIPSTRASLSSFPARTPAQA